VLGVMPGGIVVLVVRGVDGFGPGMLVAGIRRVCFVLGMRPMIGVPVVRAVSFVCRRRAAHLLLPGLAHSIVEGRALLRSHAPHETTEREDQPQEGRDHLSSRVE
jgi:hypothetical protein